MKFLRLDVQAFKRFREPFSIPLDGQGLVLVEGENRDGADAANSNGAGKSLAIVETLLWCLYGRMARYGNKPVTDEAVHHQRGANVSVTFETRGYPYTATRSRAVKGNPTFIVGGSNSPVPLSRDPSRRADAVASLLGFDYNAFRYAVVVQGGESLARAGFTTQMAVLEAILRMDELSTAAELARQRANKLDKELSGARVEVKLKRQAVDQAQQLAEQVRASGSIDYDGEIVKLEANLQEAEDWAGRLAVLRDTAATAAGVHDRAQREEAGRRAEWGAAFREWEAVSQSLKSAVCPTCKRPLKSEAEQGELLQEAARKASAVEGAKREHEQAQQRLATATTKKQAMEKEVREAEIAASVVPKIQEQIGQLQRQREEFEQQVALAEGQVDQARDALAEAEARTAPLELSHSRAVFWAQGYGRDGLPADVFSAAVPVLNAAAARYCQLLTCGAITVAFNPVRGVRTEDLVRIEGAEAPTYDGLSSGQKERVDLIIALSLRDLARWRLPEPVNLCVFDECFDSVDEAGLRVVSRLLQEETRDGGSTFVVTHNAAMKALFPGARVLRVIRQNGEAEVRYVA